MAIIIERLNRRGKVTQVEKFHQSAIRLGRGYDNDVVLNDETVDVHHAEIELTSAGSFTVRDLNSLNGVELLQKKKRTSVTTGVAEFKSPQTLVIGQSEFRVSDSDIPMAATTKIHPRTALQTFSETPLYAIVALLAFLAFECLQFFLDSVFVQEPLDYLRTSFENAFAIGFITLFLSIVARLSIQRWNVWTNLFYLNVLFIGFALADVVINIVYFNFGYGPMPWLISLLESAVLTILGTLLLLINIAVKKRWLQATIVSSFTLVVLVYGIVQHYSSDWTFEEFSPPVTDRYSSVVLPTTSALSKEEFLTDIQTLMTD